MNAQRPTVLVPLDGSTHATVALPVAKTMARLEGAVLHVIHVSDQPSTSRELAATLGLTLDEVRGAVIEPLPGRPADAIVRAASERGSALIVMCTHTAMARAGHGLGRTAAEVTERAPCPVLLVGPARGVRSWEPRAILAPLDGSPTTAAAVQPAAELARRADAELLVLHVGVARTESPDEAGTLAGARYIDQPQHEWPAWAREFCDRVVCLCGIAESVKVRTFLAAGEPAEEILRVAGRREIDLIVLGWRATLESGRAATLKAVLQGAKCPVLLLRSGAGVVG